MLQAWGSRWVAIVVALASVIFVATYWGFYPVGLIVLLGVGNLAWFVERRSRGREAPAPAPDEPGQKRHDARIVSEVREVMPRRAVEWLRTYDFGASWRTTDMTWIFSVHERLDDVEHHPFDDELAIVLANLLEAIDATARAFAEDSFSVPGSNGDWTDTGWSDLPGGKYGSYREIITERRWRLNNAADEVGKAYDEFIDVARRKLLLNADDAG